MKKGFSLIELLIASVILIIVMVMAGSVFASASSYNVRLHEMRSVAQVSRSTIEQLSGEIRLANGSMRVKYKDAGRPMEAEVGEIALFQCSGTASDTCRLIKKVDRGTQVPTVLNDETISSKADYNLYKFPLHLNDANEAYVANALLIASKDSGKVIFYRNISSGNNYDLHRLEMSYSADAIDMGRRVMNIDAPDWTIINHTGTKGVSLRVAMAGYTAAKDVRRQQPFVEMLIRAESWDYVNLAEKLRAQFDLKTSVETRDYNPN